MTNNKRKPAGGPATTRRRFLAGSFGSILGAGWLAGRPRSARAARREAPWDPAAEDHLRIGVAAIDITPEGSVPMSGFAARTEPSQGVYQNLYAKVMTIDDGRERLVLVCADIINWRPAVAERMQARARDAFGLEPRRLLLNASHTHCGPVVANEYGDVLIGRTLEAIGRSIDTLRPARLYFGRGRSDIAMSRRGPDLHGYATWQADPYGPVDHELVVLKAVGADGRPFAVLTNYACHPTTIDGLLIGGDFAGSMNAFLEDDLDGVTALFFQGCGGDQKVRNLREDDPLRFSYGGGPERVHYFGRQIADSALAVLAGPMERIGGRLDTALDTVEMPFLEAWINADERGFPAFAQIEDEHIEVHAEGLIEGDDRRVARLAQMMLRSMDERGRYNRTQTMEIYRARIGEDFVLIALNGEISVPIGLRIKGRLRRRKVLVGAYTGRSIGYIPAMEQIPAGGYEVFRNGLRRPFSLEVEDVIVTRAVEMAG